MARLRARAGRARGGRRKSGGKSEGEKRGERESEEGRRRGGEEKGEKQRKNGKRKLTRQLSHASDSPRGPDELARDEQGVVAVEGVAVLVDWLVFEESKGDKGEVARRRRRLSRPSLVVDHQSHRFSRLIASARLSLAPPLRSTLIQLRWMHSNIQIKLTLRSKKRRAPPGEGGSAVYHATKPLSCRSSLVEQENGVRPAVAALVAPAAMDGLHEGAGVAMARRRGARRRGAR